MVRDQIGLLSERYLPFIYSIFFLVLIGNLISNIPYSYAVNASAITTLGISVTIFMGVTILSLSIHKIKFSSYLFKLFSSSILISVLTLIPFSLFLGLIGLELAVSLIQAFVLTLLVCSYLKDAIDICFN